MMDKIEEIIEFVNGWREANGLFENVLLSDEQITFFIGQLQEQIALMDFSLPKNTTIIGYTGESNGVRTWEIAETTSSLCGDSAVYISDLPAGKLLNSSGLRRALTNVIGDKEAVSMIMSGCDSDWNRIGPNCGYGDYLSLDDFVSSKLMGECTGVSNNVIIFAPEELNPNKVFCATELESIFANDTFKYINGIPKEELSALYYSGEAGRNSVYQIISRTSREVVGSTSVKCNISVYKMKTVAA